MAKKNVGKSTPRAPKTAKGSTWNTPPSPKPRRASAHPKPAKSAPKSTEKSRKPPTTEFIARAILLDSSRILLCFNPDKEYYYLPGGHIEFGEPAAAALKRELLEECGLPIRVGPLVMVDEHAFRTKKRPHHELNLVFHVEHDPRHQPSDDSNKSKKVTTKRSAKADWRDIRSLEDGLELRWVDLAAAVDLDIRPESAKAFLASGAGALAPKGHNPPATEWVSIMNLP